MNVNVGPNILDDLFQTVDIISSFALPDQKENRHQKSKIYMQQTKNYSLIRFQLINININQRLTFPISFLHNIPKKLKENKKTTPGPSPGPFLPCRGQRQQGRGRLFHRGRRGPPETFCNGGRFVLNGKTKRLFYLGSVNI